MTFTGAKVAVVGGGAAGVSAATWLRSLGVEFDWFTGGELLGGLLHRVSNPIANHPPGQYDDGQALARSFQTFVEERGLEYIPSRIDAIDREDDGFVLRAGSREHRADAVIVATGTRYRTLGIPGESEGLGKWVSQSAAADAERFRGSDVIVVGGGDAAFENALRLSDVDCSVRMAIRSDDFRARIDFVDRVRDDPAIEILPIPTVLEAIESTDDGCRVIAQSQGDRVELACAGVFVRIGVEPVVPDLPDEVGLDRRGYIEVDRDGASSVPGLFAAGDVTTTSLRSVATAVGDGARCARSAAIWIGAFYDR